VHLQLLSWWTLSIEWCHLYNQRISHSLNGDIQCMQYSLDIAVMQVHPKQSLAVCVQKCVDCIWHSIRVMVESVFHSSEISSWRQAWEVLKSQASLAPRHPRQQHRLHVVGILCLRLDRIFLAGSWWCCVIRILWVFTVVLIAHTIIQCSDVVVLVLDYCSRLNIVFIHVTVFAAGCVVDIIFHAKVSQMHIFQ